MANINIGYLLKKRNVKFNNRNIEIFEFIDYVTGITFCNKDKINRCNIISGNYSGIYASFMSKLYHKYKNELPYYLRMELYKLTLESNREVA